MTGAAAPIVVGLPEPVGRPARLGPFPSGRDALKFAGFAAAGAVAADASNPLLWIPFLAAGAVVGLVRVGGKPADAHAVDYVRWRWQRRRPRRRRSPATDLGAGAGTAALAGGRRVAVVAANGAPLAFLPTGEARALFDGYRTLLKVHAHGLAVRVDADPIDAAPYLPTGAAPADPAEAQARAEYAETVRAIVRRRRSRRVELLTWSDAGEPDAALRLEERVQSLVGGLMSLGLAVERRTGAELRRSLTGFGLAEGAA